MDLNRIIQALKGTIDPKLRIAAENELNQVSRGACGDPRAARGRRGAGRRPAHLLGTGARRCPGGLGGAAGSSGLSKGLRAKASVLGSWRRPGPAFNTRSREGDPGAAERSLALTQPWSRASVRCVPGCRAGEGLGARGGRRCRRLWLGGCPPGTCSRGCAGLTLGPGRGDRSLRPRATPRLALVQPRVYPAASRGLTPHPASVFRGQRCAPVA